MRKLRFFNLIPSELTKMWCMSRKLDSVADCNDRIIIHVDLSDRCMLKQIVREIISIGCQRVMVGMIIVKSAIGTMCYSGNIAYSDEEGTLTQHPSKNIL